jgi:hypothetical protein
MTRPLKRHLHPAPMSQLLTPLRLITRTLKLICRPLLMFLLLMFLAA